MERVTGIIKRIMAGLTAFFLLAVCGCSPEAEPSGCELTKDIRAKPVTTQVPSDAFFDGSATFGVELFKRAYQEAGHSNTLVAPLTLQTVLAMTANGAKGETLKQMETVLSGIPIDEMNRMLSRYQNRYQNRPDIEEAGELTMANSIWINDKLNTAVNPGFLQTTKDFYQSEVYKAPFNGATTKQINRWVSDHTNERIPKLVEDPITDNLLILVNATLFRAEWEKPYTRKSVHEQVFTSRDGRRQTVDMMSSQESLYVHDEQMTGFIKPYYDTKYSFMALLPNEDISVDELVSSLGGGQLRKVFREAEPTTVYAGLPKFTFEDQLDAKDTLKEMGMPDAFDGMKADFSGIVPNGPLGKLYIDKVTCKTFIRVNETGTEAAAAAEVEIKAGGIPVQPVTVTLDRPFVFVIMDNESGYPLFLGAVTSIN